MSAQRVEVKEIIKKKKDSDYYWIASKVTYSRKNVSRTTYFPCMPIKKELVPGYIRLQGDVFASSKAAAKRAAIAVNGSPPVGPENLSTGTPGYFYHYHARKRVGAGNGGGHIFYLS